MTDVVLGVIFGFVVTGLFLFVIYLFIDYAKLRIIKYKVHGNPYWQIAFNEQELNLKMNGRLGEVIMPEKPLVIRLYRKLFPLKGKSI